MESNTETKIFYTLAEAGKFVDSQWWKRNLTFSKPEYREVNGQYAWAVDVSRSIDRPIDRDNGLSR